MSHQSFAKVMISVHCATMLAPGNALKKYLIERGYTVFLCDQINVGDNFRHLICLNAASCLFFVPFINEEWCKSRECAYEFNIALSTHNRTGSPDIIPIFLESFDFFRVNIAKYPVAFSLTCNYQGFCVSKSELNEDLWAKVVGPITEKQGKADLAAALEATKISPSSNLTQSTTASRPPSGKLKPQANPQGQNKELKEAHRPSQETRKPSDDNLMRTSFKQVAENALGAQKAQTERSVNKPRADESVAKKSDSVKSANPPPKRETQGAEQTEPQHKLSPPKQTSLSVPSSPPTQRAPSPRRSRPFPSPSPPSASPSSSSPPENRPPAQTPMLPHLKESEVVSFSPTPKRANTEPRLETSLAKDKIAPLNVSQLNPTQVPLPPSPAVHRDSSRSASSPSLLPSSSLAPLPIDLTFSSLPSPISSPDATSKLFRALWAQNSEAFSDSLRKGAQVNERSLDGLTPLYVASVLGYLDGVTALVERGAEIHMRTGEGETPLFAAAQNGHADVVKYLIDKGADYNEVVGPTRLTSLMQACSSNHLEVVKHLARCEFISINAQEMQYGMTALCFAAAGGHAAIVSELLLFGADPNMKTWEWSTALLIASANGYAEIVRELCMKQADTAVQDKGGETALHRAVLGGHVEAVLALVYVPLQPAINVRNNHNATALFIACALGNLEMVRVLIQVGADMNAMTKHETPLSVALARANITVVLELLQCGAKHDLEPQLVQTIIAGTCSNLLGNNTLRQQFWLQCLDCFGDTDSRLCLACALVFHREHALRYHSFTYYMCSSNGCPPNHEATSSSIHSQTYK